MFETFDHTADLGLRIVAPDLPTLFGEAAQALVAILVADPATVRPAARRSLQVAGAETDYLLFDWLNELLYLFESEHWLPARAEVTLDPSGLTGKLFGEPFDPQRHLLDHEVKAITYHGLSVAPCDEGWRAEVIVDI